jgi:hypothetical protein
MEDRIDHFYEIMDLFYEFNKKYPEIRFGQLIHNLFIKGHESIFYISDEELFKRLKIIFESMEKE